MDNPIDKDKTTDIPSTIRYPHHVGSALIQPEDCDGFKNRGINKVNNEVKTRLLSLKQEYDKILEELEWNKIIYKSDIRFEPIVGQSYYLYKRKSGGYFLSMINPNQWKMEFIGSFELNPDLKWVKNE